MKSCSIRFVYISKIEKYTNRYLSDDRTIYKLFNSPRHHSILGKECKSNLHHSSIFYLYRGPTKMRKECKVAIQLLPFIGQRSPAGFILKKPANPFFQLPHYSLLPRGHSKCLKRVILYFTPFFKFMPSTGSRSFILKRIRIVFSHFTKHSMLPGGVSVNIQTLHRPPPQIEIVYLCTEVKVAEGQGLYLQYILPEEAYLNTLLISR